MQTSFLAHFVQVQDLPGPAQVAGGAPPSDSRPLIGVTNDVQELQEGVPGHCPARRAAWLHWVSRGALCHHDRLDRCAPQGPCGDTRCATSKDVIGHLERAPGERQRCSGARERACLPPLAPPRGRPGGWRGARRRVAHHEGCAGVAHCEKLVWTFRRAQRRLCGCRSGVAAASAARDTFVS